MRAAKCCGRWGSICSLGDVSTVRRDVRVPPERLQRWVDNFAAGHGGVVDVSTSDGMVTLRADDGSQACVSTLWPPVDLRQLPVACMARHAAKRRVVLVVSVRRGGFGCAVVADGAVLHSKHGTRYVQSRTAAGGWSQQRYARRRAGQSHQVVAGAVDATLRVWAVSVKESHVPVGVAIAGDTGLLRETMAQVEKAQPVVGGLPQVSVPLDGDPRMATSQELAKRVRCVRVEVVNVAGLKGA